MRVLIIYVQLRLAVWRVCTEAKAVHGLPIVKMHVIETRHVKIEEIERCGEGRAHVCRAEPRVPRADVSITHSCGNSAGEDASAKDDVQVHRELGVGTDGNAFCIDALDRNVRLGCILLVLQDCERRRVLGAGRHCDTNEADCAAGGFFLIESTLARVRLIFGRYRSD